MSIKGINLIKN